MVPRTGVIRVVATTEDQRWGLSALVLPDHGVDVGDIVVESTVPLEIEVPSRSRLQGHPVRAAIGGMSSVVKAAGAGW